jgi:pyruvate dehydrogenase E1 component beta subunit
MIEILMPAVTPEMEDGTLNRWLVKAGDHVNEGDAIAEVETDKATIEIEAQHSGIMLELLVIEGTEGIQVDAPIARLEED